MFVEKGSLLSVLSPQESSLPCESQCFVEKGFFLSIQMSAFLKNKGHIFGGKSQWKGVVFSFLERSYVLLLCLSGGTGGGAGETLVSDLGYKFPG